MNKKILNKVFGCSMAALGAAAILYIELILSFPSEITMFCGEKHSEKLGAGVTIGSMPENICTYTTADSIIPEKEGEYTAQLKLAGAIPYKKVRVHITEPRFLCASGKLLGMRIYNDGLIVLRTAEVETEDGKTVSPAKNAGIEAGDIIKEINGVALAECSNVESLLNEESVDVRYIRNGNERITRVLPVKSKTDNLKKLGVWVRDSTAGVGTMTYFSSDTLQFGALGHGISDSETGVMFDVKKGSVEESGVISVKKGVSGKPGEICGSFSSSNGIIGTINKNCEAGVFGRLSSTEGISGEKLPIGLISQISVGDAYILSTVDSEVKKYDIKIIRIMPFGSATKGLMIKITDDALLEKTGGIIQGMSGSPIIQNGKIIGAVTHVLVNDPTRGYGIFIENMLEEAEKHSD